jgi:hypothetical protein
MRHFLSAQSILGQPALLQQLFLVKAVDWKTKISAVLATKFSYHKSSFCQPYARLYGLSCTLIY